MLRLPLDTFWPNFHLAPYAFVGVGGVFIGSPGNGNNEFVERTVFVSRTEGAPATQPVTLRGRNIIGSSRTFLVAAKCSATLGADSNIALLPISGFSAKVVMTSRICQTTDSWKSSSRIRGCDPVISTITARLPRAHVRRMSDLLTTPARSFLADSRF